MDIIQLKNIIYEIKNSLNRFNSRLDMAEVRTGILEDSSIENTKACWENEKYRKEYYRFVRDTEGVTYT